VNSGFNFGKASKLSSQIRKRVESIIPYKSDSSVLYRLTGAMNKFISWKEKKDKAFVTMPQKLPFIYGFQFNDKSDLTSITAIRVSVKLKEAGLREISLAPFIPDRSLHAPANTKSILLKMITIGADLSNSGTGLLGQVEIEIPYGSDLFQPPVISAPVTANSGNLLIIVIAIQYLVARNGDVEMQADKKKQPCGIVWAECI
jgi:hypothetical protein